MLDKKEEHDELQNRSEKDLWCQDLDDFVQEWETQLKEDAEYQKSIRNTNRRASRKIGAGKNIKSRKNDDDDFQVAPSKSKPLKPNPAKGVVKVEHKSHKGFLEMFNAPKPKPKTGMGSDGADDSLSDDDFAALGAAKSESAEASRSTSEQPVNGRAKRAAAVAPKKWVIEDEESEDDDSKYLGDVGDMVKGIGGGEAEAANGRVSLFAMSRPGTSHGDRPTSSNGLPKAKPKASKPFDLSDGDETNYEMLARSSPHKAAPAPKNNLDSFLSDDDEEPIVTKKASAKAAPAARAPNVAPAVKATAKRGPKPKKALYKEPTPAPEPKPAALSPAAKAYAAKKSKMELAAKNDAFSEDEDDDIEMNDSPPPKPAAKITKAKAPAKRAVLSDDDDDLDMDDIAPPKPTAKPAAKPAAKTTKAKAKAPVKKTAISDDDDDLDMSDAPAPKPAAGRGRLARAAVSKAKAKPIYVDSDDEEEDFEASAIVDEESEDDFDDSE